MRHTERLGFLDSIKEETRLMATVALGMIVVSSAGIAEWRRARDTEAQALQELNNARGDQSAQADAKYQEAWRQRLDTEDDLTPEETAELGKEFS